MGRRELVGLTTLLLAAAVACAEPARSTPSAAAVPPASPTVSAPPAPRTPTPVAQPPTATPRPSATAPAPRATPTPPATPTAPRPAPTVTPTPAAKPPAPPAAKPPAPPSPSPTASAATLAADLSTTVARALGLPPAGAEPAEGIAGVGALPLGKGADGKPLWAAYTYGLRGLDPLQHHLVAVYARDETGWREVGRLQLAEADYVDERSVQRVEVEPSRAWLQVESGVGAHGSCYNLLSFDGGSLRAEVSHCNSHPGVGRLADLDGAGGPEVVLDTTDDYVFCYACGVRLVSYRVLRWDGSRLVEVSLAPPPDSTPAELRGPANRIFELARAGLWKDASAAAEALAGQPGPLGWNAALVRLTAEGRLRQVEQGGYPLLENVFYGDYAAALALLRPYTPAELFAERSPLVAGTPVEGMERELAQHLSAAVGSALEARPDLPAAYFLRGWATSLTEPGSPAALADVERAATLVPAEPLYSQSLAYLKGRAGR